MKKHTKSEQNAAAINSPSARLARLRAEFKPKCDALLVTNPLDVAYLTCFHGGDSYLIVPSDDQMPTLVSDSRYEEELAPFGGTLKVVIRKKIMSEAIADVLGALPKSMKRVGFQAEHVTVSMRDGLAGKLGSRVTLTATKGLVSALRAVKDSSEIKLIKKAAKIQEQALLAMIDKIKPGKSELEIAARLEMEMKNRGSEVPSFPTIVAAQANGSLAHYRPHDVDVKKNTAVLIDWGATFGGYHSDMTRTFAVGKWPAKLKEAYKVVLGAHEAAADALAPGKTTFEIDKIARDHIAKHGFGENFGHGLGHGIGLNVHEEPSVSHMAAPVKLVPGHVITIEPGIYLPGIGGVRIEDDYAITETGGKCLCSLPKDLEWATL